MGVTAVVLLLAGCVAVGYAMKGVAGFGEIIPLVAVGQLLVDRADLVVVATVLSLTGGLVAMRVTGAVAWHDVRRDAVRLAAGAVAGVALGAFAPRAVVTIGFAATLLAASIALVVTALRREPTAPRVRRAVAAAGPSHLAVFPSPGHAGGGRLAPIGVVAAGVTGGIAGVDGPPLAAALASRGGDFRPALVTLLVISSSFRLALLGAGGAVHAATVGQALLLLVPAAAGYLVGRRVAAHVGQATVIRAAASIAVVGSILALVPR